MSLTAEWPGRGELPEDNSSSARVSGSACRAGSFPLRRIGRGDGLPLPRGSSLGFSSPLWRSCRRACSLSKRRLFSCWRRSDRSASRSSAGLGHPAFFPCLDASGGIGLRWAGCSGCRPLESNSTVQNFGEEWREPGETWGCRRAFAAKLTPNVVEAFSSVPTDGANCCIWDLRHCRASTASMNLQPAKNKQGVRRWFAGPPLRWQSQF